MTLHWRDDGTLILRSGDPSVTLVPGHRRYWLGLDPGSRLDPSAYVILLDEIVPGWKNTSVQERGDRTFTVVWADVLMDSKWPTILQYTLEVMHKPKVMGRIKLAIDATGPGRPLSDFLFENKLEHMPVTTTGGEGESQEGRDYRVSKSVLLGDMAVAFEQGDLTIARNLPLRDRVVNDIAAFRLKTTAAGNTTIDATRRDGSHSDLGIATALALFAAKRAWVGPHVGALAGMY